MAKTYTKGPDAPAEWKPDIDPGATFKEEYDDSTERALLCAGWIASPDDKKKGDK